MKKIYLILMILTILTPGCINWGLEELPTYQEADILDFDFEYRYTVKNDNGVEQLAVKTLNTDATISGNTVNNNVTVPAPSGSFTENIAAQVSLTNIIGYVKLSTAALIEPLEGAPELGTKGDYSKTLKYKVTAANGETKIWTVNTTLSR